MSRFYEKYRSLFEEDEMSSNYALRLLAGSNRKLSAQNFENTPERKHMFVPEPVRKVHQLQKQPLPPPNINVVRSNLLYQRSPVPKLSPLKADALNALLENYPQPSKPPLPAVPKINDYGTQKMTDYGPPPVEDFRKGNPALRNVYKHSLVKQNYYDFSNKRDIESRGKQIAEVRAEPNSHSVNVSMSLKETYKPESMISQVPTSENLFPTPPKKSDKIEDEKEEYKFMRKYRESKKHREKAKKMLRDRKKDLYDILMAEGHFQDMKE